VAVFENIRLDSEIFPDDAFNRVATPFNQRSQVLDYGSRKSP